MEMKGELILSSIGLLMYYVPILCQDMVDVQLFRLILEHVVNPFGQFLVILAILLMLTPKIILNWTKLRNIWQSKKNKK